MADFTKYIFNNNEYGKGKLVLAVVRQYISDNNADYSTLLEVFPSTLQGGFGVFISAEKSEQILKDGKYVGDRYFIKEDESLTTTDGVKIFISNQWGTKENGPGNFDRFFAKAIDLGYEIKIKGKKQITIKDLFDEYKASPRLKWMASFKASTDALLSYKGKETADYDLTLLDEVWKSAHNGVASVRPGFISNAEYESLVDELPDITFKIINDPSPSTFDDVVSWAKQAKAEGRFSTIKWGVISRVFATANPKDCSTLLEKKKALNLINKLNELYHLGISTTGNWATLNLSLLNALRANGLENEDVYMVNTFVWRLYTRFVKNAEKPQGVQQQSELTSFGTDTSCVNVIYYGPPGTGKTYKLQKTLINQYTENSVLPDKHLWLSEKIDELSWFEITAIILLDSEEAISVSDIISHEYFKLKSEINDRKQNIRQTAWAALQTHTIQESTTVKYAKRIEPTVFNKNEDSSWYIVDSQNEQLDEYRNILSSLKAGPKQKDTIQRYEFVTFHQSYGYEEFIEGLRPVSTPDGNISYEIKAGAFKRICKRAESDPDNQYAIVIDEINRGNISKIFGELITLVETDKRAGADNALTLTLPYSGLPFSVPSNLDIIGTMNTADRSLTHVDVALRRRFEFIELRADYSLIPDDMDGINLRWMLYAINQRIELLLDREHILGHALLMNVRSIGDLRHVFSTNIMPLLEEYFFENWDKINRVLNNNGFIEEKEGASATWLGGSDDYTARSYRINLNKLSDSGAYRTIYSSVPDGAFSECNADAE